MNKESLTKGSPGGSLLNLSSSLLHLLDSCFSIICPSLCSSDLGTSSVLGILSPLIGLPHGSLQPPQLILWLPCSLLSPPQPLLQTGSSSGGCRGRLGPQPLHPFPQYLLCFPQLSFLGLLLSPPQLVLLQHTRHLPLSSSQVCIVIIDIQTSSSILDHNQQLSTSAKVLGS